MKEKLLLSEMIPNIKQKFFSENNIVTLVIERKSIVDRIICWLFRKPKVGYLRLDKMSSKVFLLIDGKKTIADITDCILSSKEENQDTVSMLERVSSFLFFLDHRRFIELLKKPLL